jgi:hypothetical protein
MASGLTYQVFVNIGKIFHRLPWPAFILGFSALFTLGLVCPHLWTFMTCGNTTCGAFVFPPYKVMHCMILVWKTDMMGLMLAFQFTIILRVKVSITQGKKKSSFSIQFGPTPLFHPPKSISCPITIHCRTIKKLMPRGALKI